MARANTPFFFDIETGGFNKGKSSVFSISFGTHPKRVESFYAKPTQGTFISRWSEKHVWEPIKRQHGILIEDEASILRKFLTRLQGLPEGQTVAGWNIGYTPRPGGRGFDIPMLMARAEKYGMGEEYRRAFQKLRVRDIGQEFAYKISKEVSQYEHLVEKGVLPKQIFESSKAYAELGLRYELGAGATEQLAARYLAEEFKSVTGWKQEVAHAMFMKGGYKAHMSAADVASGLGLSQILKKKQLFKSEAQVVEWGQEALYRSLVSQAMRPAHMYMGEPEVPTAKYPRLIEAAKEMERTGGDVYKGFSERVITGINIEAAQRGAKISDIIAGKGAPEAGRWIGTKEAVAAKAFGLPPKIRDAAKFLWKYKLPIGIAAGATALYMAQPLQYFSGKDDYYNEIEGLPHGAEAERMRRILTDFGSGWLRTLGRVFKRRRIFKEGRRWLKAQNIKVVAPKVGRGVEFDPTSRIMYWSEKSAMRQAMKAGLTKAEAKLATPSMFAHEVAEARHVARTGKEFRAFGGHAGPEVIAEEMFTGARMGPEAFAAIKKLRLAEIRRMRTGVAPRMKPSYENMAERLARKEWRPGMGSPLELQWEAGAMEREYMARVPKIIRGIEEKHLSKFDGFTEEGIAALMRKDYGFGSGWIGAVGRFAKRLFPWGRKARFLTKAKGLPIPKPLAGEFAISASELPYMSHVQISERLGMLGSASPVNRTLGRQAEMMAWRPSAAELAKAEEGVILSRTTLMGKPRAPTDPIPTGPELVKMIQDKQQNNVQRMLAQLQQDNLASGAKNVGAGTYAGPAPKRIGSATETVTKKAIPTHDAMLAETRIRKREEWYRKHKESMVRASTNATRPGRRHVDQTGKIVF